MIVEAKGQDFFELRLAKELLLAGGGDVVSGQVYETLHDVLIQPPDTRHEDVAGIMRPYHAVVRVDELVVDQIMVQFGQLELLVLGQRRRGTLA